MVDIAREERIEKWDIFVRDLKEFHESPDTDLLYISKEVFKSDVGALLSKVASSQ